MLNLVILLFSLLFLILTSATSSSSEKIDFHMSHGTGGDPDAFSNLYRTLITDHSIRALSLKVEQGGCVYSDDPWAFSFIEGDRFPPLVEISLDGYDFDAVNRLYTKRWTRHTSGIHGWRWYLADEYGYEWLRPSLLPKVGDPPFEIEVGSNLALWKKAMDWSHVESLELTDVKLETFMNQMDGELPSLKSLKLIPWSEYVRPLANQISHFISRLPRLESLFFYSMTNILNLTDILTTHGPTLKSLELREWEPEEHPRPVLSPNQLKNIDQQCPSLRKLSIDINRNGTWPYRVLDAIASFENVHTLSLNLELGIDQHTDESFFYDPPWARNTTKEAYRQPSVNNESSVELFKYMREKKKGVELERLMLTVGDWGRDFGGGMRTSGWGEGLEEMWECGVVDESSETLEDESKAGDEIGKEVRCDRIGGWLERPKIGNQSVVDMW